MPSIVVVKNSESGASAPTADATVKEAAATTAETTTPQRRVTPLEGPSAKKQQQKKVNQMTLSNFFHKASSTTASTKKQTAKKDEASSHVPVPPPSTAAAAPTEVTQVGSCVMDVEVTAPPAVDSTAEMKGRPARSSAAIQEDSTEIVEVVAVDELPQSVEELKEATAVVVKEDPPAKKAPARKKKAPAAGKRKRQLKGTTAATTTSEDSSTTTPVAKAAKKKKDEDQVVVVEPEIPLSDERTSLLEKHAAMMQRCEQRSDELVQVGREGRLDEEDYEMPAPQIIMIEEDKTQDFPDAVVQNMALLIEGSPLPLSELTLQLCQKLKECHGRDWSTEAMSNKIKLVAERRPFLDNAAILCKDVHIKYEDTSVDRLWRWEVGILDVLPSTIIPKVRKARMACKKLLLHYMANQKLMKSLQDADAIIRDMKSQKVEATLVKIAKDEEKVLKYEREAEKLRLVQLAKKKKDEEFESKKKEKERKKEEAEKKRLEKEREKLEAAEARETEKKKKQEEKEKTQQAKIKKEEKKKAAAKKQKACLMSFFAKPKKAASPQKAVPSTSQRNQASSNDFDPKAFRSSMNSTSEKFRGPLFPTLSAGAIQSRKRRTRKVPLTVHVTIIPDSNAFGEQPFAEQQTIQIPNKYRFLSFHEDYRPAYHGTWSKRSTLVTGKTPFGKDATFLDYDYDSEAEWEEGDDEIGEDVDDDAKNQEEEEEDHSAKMYDYDDGFCVADDQYLDIDEDVDEETKALYRKKLQRGDAGVAANRISIVGPAVGGIPVQGDCGPELMEGFETRDEALELLKTHTGRMMSKGLLWLDAFAPDNIDDLEPVSETDKQNTAESASKDEYTLEEVRILATFAHHNSLNSKDKLIEELRNDNPNVFDNRAKATRKLDSIAEKKKHPSGNGVYWEVNKKVLEELELHSLLAKELAGAKDVPAPKKKVASKKRKDLEGANEGKKATNPKPASSKKSKSKSSKSKSPPNSKLKAVAATAKASPTSDVPAKKALTDTQVAASPTKVPVATLAAPITNFLQPRKKLKVAPVASPST